MKKLILVLFAAIPLAAQLPPPRDLPDAQRVITEMQRQISPALAAAAQEAATLATITKAWKQLADNQPRFAIDAALKTIEAFIEQEEEAGRPLSREMRQELRLAKDAIERARVTASPADIETAREWLHHELIHPLQAQVMTNVQHIITLQQMAARMAEQTQRTMQSSLAAVQGALNEK